MMRTRRRATALPDRFFVEVTPGLLRSLNGSHEYAGRIDELAQHSLNDDDRRTLLEDGRRERATHLLSCIDVGVEPIEADQVLAGDSGGATRLDEGALGAARALSSALETAAHRGPTTPATCTVYLEIAESPANVGRRGGPPTDQPRPEPTIREVYERLYAEPLLASEAILRAGVLYAALREVYPGRRAAMGVAAVAYHELIAGGLDPSHGLVFPYGLEHNPLYYERFRRAHDVEVMLDTGDATALVTTFAAALRRALADQHQRVLRKVLGHQRQIATLDALDREIVGVLETLGPASSRELAGAMESPPPLRTLQRRLQNLVGQGLVHKTGSRKGARYLLGTPSRPTSVTACRAAERYAGLRGDNDAE